jgi:hypothetical protein
MGYTLAEVNLISKYVKPGMSVLDFGSQNLYVNPLENPPFVSQWYNQIGIADYTCIDLAGDNNALRIDVSKERTWPRQYDLVVDGGFGEHIVQAEEYETISFHGGHINSVYPKEGQVTNKLLGFYNFWVNKYKLCKNGGMIVSVNPKTGNWPGHCYHYLTQDFYFGITHLLDCDIVELTESPAMGNTETGWNIICILEKQSDRFPTFKEFQTLPIFDK